MSERLNLKYYTHNLTGHTNTVTKWQIWAKVWTTWHINTNVLITWNLQKYFY